MANEEMNEKAVCALYDFLNTLAKKAKKVTITIELKE